MVCHRPRLTIAVVLGIALWWSGASPDLVRAASEEQIKGSIARAIGYIKSRIGSQAGGQLALSTLALLKAEAAAEWQVLAGLMLPPPVPVE